MPGSDGQRILGDFGKKKPQLVEIWTMTKRVEIRTGAKRVDFRASARPGQLGLRDAPRVLGPDGTVSIVKIVSLSPRVENLKVKKVIKVWYLNCRESLVFRDSYAYERFTDLYILYIRIMDMLQEQRWNKEQERGYFRKTRTHFETKQKKSNQWQSPL